MDELVEKAKKGDAEAYTQLMLSIRNDLYKICKTRIISDDEIEDIIQETMIKTFNQLKKLRDVSKFKSWIISILINNCNMQYRTKQKVRLYESNCNYETYIENRQASDNIDMIDSDIDFYLLISKLNYEERIIVILHYAENFTFKEISKILRINENTVKTRLYRAKEKLKYICKGEIEIG